MDQWKDGLNRKTEAVQFPKIYSLKLNCFS